MIGLGIIVGLTADWHRHKYQNRKHKKKILAILIVAFGIIIVLTCLKARAVFACILLGAVQAINPISCDTVKIWPPAR